MRGVGRDCRPERGVRAGHGRQLLGGRRSPRHGVGRVEADLSAERLGDLAGGREPLGRCLPETARDEGEELGRQVGAARLERLRLLVQDAIQHGDVGGPAERPHPREHLVEHRAEREHVAPRVDLEPPLGLLGGHVPGRPHDATLDGQLRGGGGARLAGESVSRSFARPKSRIFTSPSA